MLIDANGREELQNSNDNSFIAIHVSFFSMVTKRISKDCLSHTSNITKPIVLNNVYLILSPFRYFWHEVKAHNSQPPDSPFHPHLNRLEEIYAAESQGTTGDVLLLYERSYWEVAVIHGG